MINIHSIKDHVPPEDVYLCGRLDTLSELIELFSGRNKRKGALYEIKVKARNELIKRRIK